MKRLHRFKAGTEEFTLEIPTRKEKQKWPRVRHTGAANICDALHFGGLI